MYQEIILDHYKRPHGKGLNEEFQAEVHHVNPTCGDEITLRVSGNEDGTIRFLTTTKVALLVRHLPRSCLIKSIT